MKKLLLLLLLTAQMWATTTVTGTLRNLDTTTVGSNTFVRMWLRGCGNNIPRVNGTALIVPGDANYYVDFYPNTSGVISGSVYATRDAAGTGNGEIECGGSLTAAYYGVQIFYNGAAGTEVPVVAKLSATLDLTNATPLTTAPVSTAPTGDNTYLRLDGGNSPIVGSITSTGDATFRSLTITTGGSFAGTITGTPTFSGNPIFSGNPSFTGAASATKTFTAGDYAMGALTTQNFVFEGDSRTAVGNNGTVPIAPGEEWPALAMALGNFASRGTSYNPAAGGSTCTSMTARYAASVYPQRPTGAVTKAYLFVMIGINDVNASTPANTIFTCITSYWNTAKADGFTVVALTNYYGYYSAGYGPDATLEGIRVKLNDLIRTSTIPDVIIDLDRVIRPATYTSAYLTFSTNIYSDAVHLNVSGNRLIAKTVNVALSEPTRFQSTSFADIAENVYSRSGIFHVINGAILAGNSTAGASTASGDIQAARTDTTGVYRAGNDNLWYIFRDVSSSTWQLPHNLNFSRSISVGGNPSGGSFISGDGAFSRTANTGAIFLGTDAVGYVYRDTATSISIPTTFTFKTGAVSSATYATTTNCSSAASPAVCGAASAGSAVVAAAATFVQVNDTALTANSQIMVSRDDSLGTKLGVTCNTQSSLVLGTPRVTSRVAATSFTVTIDAAPTTNPMCFSYQVVN